MFLASIADAAASVIQQAAEGGWFDHFIKEHATEWGLPFLWFLLLIAGLGVPLPEDIPIASAGFLCAQQLVDGSVPWHQHALYLGGVYSGVIVGDSIVYWLGHTYGEAILQRPMIARLMTPARVEKARAFFKTRGALAVIIARNIAGVRFPTFLMAGITRMGYWKFIFCDGISGLVSVPFYFYLGYGAGKNMDAIKEHLPAVIVGLIVLVVVVIMVKKFVKKRVPV